jgi:hypothetical protein
MTLTLVRLACMSCTNKSTEKKSVYIRSPTSVHSLLYSPVLSLLCTCAATVNSFQPFSYFNFQGRSRDLTSGSLSPLQCSVGTMQVSLQHTPPDNGTTGSYNFTILLYFLPAR